jgi:hypothetical protein
MSATIAPPEGGCTEPNGHGLLRAHVRFRPSQMTDEELLKEIAALTAQIGALKDAR